MRAKSRLNQAVLGCEAASSRAHSILFSVPNLDTSDASSSEQMDICCKDLHSQKCKSELLLGEVDAMV